MRSLAYAGMVLAGVAACAGGQTRGGAFSEAWQDPGGRAGDRVVARLAHVKPPPGANVAIVVAASGDRVTGLPLDGSGHRWTFAHPLDVRPAPAGAVVVVSGGGEVVGLLAATGRELWARPTGGAPLRGAGDDGNVTVMTFAATTGDGAVGSRLLAVGRDGTIVRQVETDASLGVPAVTGGLAFVPWGRQVTVFDLTNGDEAARIEFSETTSHAFTTGGELFFGDSALVRFDAAVFSAGRGGAHALTVGVPEFPGGPMLTRNGAEPIPPAADARDKVRLYASPDTDRDSPALEGDRTIASYYRFVVGLSAPTPGSPGTPRTPGSPGTPRTPGSPGTPRTPGSPGTPRTPGSPGTPPTPGSIAWLRDAGSDVIGGAVGDGFFAECNARGEVTFIDLAAGGTLSRRDVGEIPRSCVLQIDGMRAPTPPRDAPPPPPLVEALAAALRDGAPPLLPARRLFVRVLGAVAGERATETLTSLAADSGAPPELRDDARAALASRRAGEAPKKPE